MKNRVLLLISVCFFYSCSSGKLESGNYTASSLNGTWFESNKELSIRTVEEQKKRLVNDIGRTDEEYAKEVQFSWGKGIINSGTWSFDLGKMMFSESGSSAEILKIMPVNESNNIDVVFVIDRSYDEENKVVTYLAQKFTIHFITNDKLEVLDSDRVFGIPVAQNSRIILYRLSGPGQ